MGKRHQFVDQPPVTRICGRGCVIRAEHLKDCEGNADAPCTGCVPCPAQSDHHAMCEWCGKALMKWLGDVPANLETLASGLEPSNKPGSGSHSKLSGSPDFARSRATVQLVRETVTLLATWCRDITPTTTLTPPADPLQAAGRFATWLTGHEEAVLKHAAVADRMETLQHLRSRARRQSDPPPKNRFELPGGKLCPGKGEPCGHTLWTTLYQEHDGRQDSIWCTGPERHEFGTWEWRRLMERLGFGPLQANRAEAG